MMNNIKSFLYDKDYFINIFDNYIHVFNYLDLNNFSDEQISLKMENFNLLIKGKNLSIVKMAQKEILIEGILKGIDIN